MKRYTFAPIAFAVAALLVACEKPADVVSYNVSQAADRFEVNRRIVFFNGITDKYLLVVEGFCALGNHDKYKELSVVCKIGPNRYLKHFLGLSDNVTYMAQQLDDIPVSSYHYRLVFRPETLIPSVEVDVQ